jgi:membrane-bound lytic murein transglycosylase B
MQRAFLKATAMLLSSLLASAAFSLPQNIQKFVDHMHNQYGFSKQALMKTLSQQKPNQSILTIEHRPYEHKTWPVFRDGLITTKRIQEGVIFYKAHQKELLDVQNRYHVNPYVITAIIGFESTYGRNEGRSQALNSLYTLGFYYPPREKYFQKELANLFLLARAWHKPVKSIQSSFDGGLGMPQFMPDMYLKMARSAKPKHFPDLMHSPNDAIESVAYYLQQSHWNTHSFIASPMQVKGKVLQPDCHYQKKETYTIDALKQNGFVISNVIKQKKVGCVSLEDREMTDYWVIGDNFYAIQKYNPQVYYVLVVNDLSNAIRKQLRAISK